MKFGCFLIVLSFVFLLIATERSESHDLENPEKEEHTAVHAIQDKEEEPTNQKKSYSKNLLGVESEGNPKMSEAEEADEILRCSSKVVDAIITYQLMSNDKCKREDRDGNFLEATFNCCRDHQNSYCTSIDQLRKFNGQTPTKGEKRVCLDEKKKKSLEKVFRSLFKEHDVPVTTPDNYEDNKGNRLSEDNEYFVYSGHAFRCKPDFSVYVDLKKKVEECRENGGGDECRVDNLINTECERLSTKELYAEKDSFLVQYIPELCRKCFCKEELSVLWDNPEIFLKNATIRQLFKDLNLDRLNELSEIVRFSMKDSPVYQFKPQVSTSGDNIFEKRPSLTCDKPEQIVHG